MKKSFRIARISNSKVKKEDSIELSDAQVTTIINQCQMKKEGYALDEIILSKLLAFSIGRNNRFDLLALLIDVKKGFRYIVFV